MTRAILPTAIRSGVWMAYLGFAYDLFTTGLNWGTALAFMALVGMPVAWWERSALL